MNNKQRIEIPLQEMPSQKAEIRRNNFSEVALGYTEEQAINEANRCLQCKDAPCIKGCPVAINIPAFIKEITEHNFQNAINIIKETSLLPSVCGRVCPQEVQCQLYCTVGKIHKDVNKSVSIGRLERFVADQERETASIMIPEIEKPTGKKVAIIGAGPAGLVAAADIRRAGHDVVVFEAFHKAGGVMIYGIPEFRLPKLIVQKEIDILVSMGVIFKTNFVVGQTRKLSDLFLKDGFNAVFIGTGAGLPKFMNIEGENSVGVFSANEYLTRSNLMKAYDRKKAATPIAQSEKVIVLGGGNVAMDSARMALRLGAKKVSIMYRRTEAEMPARTEEIEHAKEEGVEFELLQNVIRILADEKGKVNSVECIRYELGDADESGRRRPVEIKDSNFIVPVDTVIIAIGNESNPLIIQTTPQLKTNKKGNILINEYGQTSMENVYAGGDIVLGSATVILAMGQGRNAAKSVNNLLLIDKK